VNALTSFPAGPGGQARVAAVCASDLHEFRSTFLDRFGKVETWIVERLLTACRPDQVPILLGQRVEALKKAIKTRPEIVKNQSKVESLLVDLVPLLELRGTLAHAVVERVHDADGHPIYLFQEPLADLGQPWRCRTALKAYELPAALKALDNLRNGLKQQTPLKPSSPPRRARGAAAAP
jgi:hypothetical protein